MRSTYAKLAAVAVFFIMLIVYVRFWWLWRGYTEEGKLVAWQVCVCVQDTVHWGCALESTQDHHLYTSVLKMLGDAWVLHLLVNPKCKGLLTTGFSPEAVCTRVLSRLTSCSSAPLQAVSFGNSQSVQVSIITSYVLLLSSSSGNWTLMNIPCVGNGWVFFFLGSGSAGFLLIFCFLKIRLPCLKAKYCSVHIVIAFTSVSCCWVFCVWHLGLFQLL